MRMLLRLVVAVAVVGTFTVVPANAGPPKLKGEFTVKEHLDSTDDPRVLPGGFSVTGSAAFECVDADCSSVTMTIAKAGGSPTDVTLMRSGAEYTGSDGPFPVECGPSTGATGTTDYSLTVKRTRHGRRVKFAGTERTSIIDCEGYSYYHWSLKGKRQ